MSIEWVRKAKQIERVEGRKAQQLPLEIREKIKKAYKQGYSLEEIQTKFKISKGIAWWVTRKVREIKRKEMLLAYTEKIQTLSEFELGYICASIDGDGSIYSSMRDGKYRISLSISNRNKRIINYFHNCMGMDVSVHSFKMIRDVSSSKRKDKGWGRIYCWKLSDKRTLKILFEKIFPRIVGKKEEIFCALKIIEGENPKKYYARLRRFKAKYNEKVRKKLERK